MEFFFATAVSTTKQLSAILFVPGEILIERIVLPNKIPLLLSMEIRLKSFA